jgi:hypothetical protein
MKVTGVAIADDGNLARLAATVTSDRFSAPMDAWFAVPSVILFDLVPTLTQPSTEPASTGITT